MVSIGRWQADGRAQDGTLDFIACDFTNPHTFPSSDGEGDVLTRVASLVVPSYKGENSGRHVLQNECGPGFQKEIINIIITEIVNIL